MADAAPLPPFLWLTEKDVTSLINLSGVVAALERALLLEAEGKAKNMYKAQTVWDAGSVNVTGAQFVSEGFAGGKMWCNVGGSSEPLTILHDASNGKVKAIFESIALGQMRTAALASVATKYLAPEGADDLAIVGTGKQSITQVAAVHVARPLKRLRVYSPTPANRASFVDLVKKQFPFEVVNAGSLEDCVKDALMVATFTRAREPFLHADMIAKGAHVTAGGAIIPAYAEISPDVVARASMIVVDNIEQCQENARELNDAFAKGIGSGWGAVKQLSEIVKAANGKPARPAGVDLTLYKFMGLGLGDVAAAIEIYKRAVAKGMGTKREHAVRFLPDLS
ncbi:MAG TPA: ornithine cyclodeaminase family protein [Alphaproteobacteria bacterium]|nr:ornithine cyclodeaminase family protein [Alphaproteobacteria bacterium]